MKLNKNMGTMICNIVCGLLLLALVICQFVPFWVIEGENADSGSLIGVTGRQYEHVELIEHLDMVTEGFAYQDISTQVLLTIVLGFVAALLCLKNSHGWFRILLAAIVGLAGVSLWLLVPAYTLGMMGTVLFVLDLLVLVVAVVMLVFFFMERKEIAMAEKEKRAKMGL